MLCSKELLIVGASAALCTGFICYLYLRFFAPGPLSGVLPWVGVDDNESPWSRARATLKSLLSTRELLQEGYYKYSKRGIPFILPNILTGPEVIVPMEQMEWLLQQPDSVLDQNEVNCDFLQADYTMLHPKVPRDTVHADVIRNELTKKLSDFVGDVVEEIDFAFRENWGVDSTQWKEICVYDSMSDVIARLSNRVLVGVPLCRDRDYSENSMKFARQVVLAASAIAMTPKFLRPLLAPFYTFYDRTLYWRCAKYIVPIVRQRTSAVLSDDKDKNDYVQWALDHAATHHDPAERSPDMISKRLAVLSFAAIQSSAITLTNLTFDLAASPQCNEYLTVMREEVESELAAEHGKWTKASLNRMYTLDSTLRESMRLWGFVSRGLLKMVVKKDGVRMPGGIHLPYRTKVGTHAHPVHHDEALYPGANEFHPFRWYGKKDSGVVEVKGKKGTSLATTSNNFMAFSHGRNACPGRHFASQQLKLTLAHIAQNYEIKPIDARPQNKWLVSASGPPLGQKIFVKRRAGTA